jgi:hypothetical protein
LKNLNEHNLITFKSASESCDTEALEEFFGNFMSYRKINLYAIVYHYPRKLFKHFEDTNFLNNVKEKEFFDLILKPLKSIRFVITRETDNPVLSLFSGNLQKVKGINILAYER